MPQLHAVAYAAFEDHFASGVAEARDKVLQYLIERDVLRELPPSDDPFGVDPALLASIGRDDTAPYHAPARTPSPDVDRSFPVAPLTAGGQ